MVSNEPSILRRILPILAGLPVAATLMYIALLMLEGQSGSILRPEERAAFPDFTLADLSGRPWTLSSQRGYVVVLNFWHTGCGPCLAETPRLVKIAKRFENQRVQMIGVACDENPQEAVPEVAQRYHMSYLILTYYFRQIRAAEITWRFPLPIESVPRTLLFDRAGRVARDYNGVVSEGILTADIEQLLNEAPVPQHR